MVKERVRKEAWAVNASKEECISDFTSVSLTELPIFDKCIKNSSYFMFFVTKY